ncbi:MAG: hypothetical protein HOP30_12620 [Cyclobacteriaceae bacterium]|nr:hypothetical protein [Cyclobacteriaceae bacterium]
MTLHCASRLEWLDYLYAKRHSIAYSLGISVEQVITSCGFSSYQGNSFAFRQVADDTAHSELLKAQEIQLFLVLRNVPQLQPSDFLINQPLSVYSFKEYNLYFSDIFHPPSC